MNWDSWIALVALTLALAGLALQWRRCLSRLEIEVGQGIPVYGQELGDVALKIEVQNKRQTPTQLRSLTVVLPNGQSAIFRDPIAEKRLPCTLGPFESTMFMLPYRELAQTLKEQGSRGRAKVVVSIGDGSGRKHRGSHKIDVDEWADS